ncbi:MAG: spore coat protein CotJB [Hydrogenibacillus sp.]|nr:spore coat protein CotJB [Hydrogenibacillus sp.]
MDARYYELLEQLQAVDFVLVDLNLYLDTHPTDVQAIQQYNHYVQARWNLAQEFERLYGPLTHFGHSISNAPWRWSESPWPWEV